MFHPVIKACFIIVVLLEVSRGAASTPALAETKRAARPSILLVIPDQLRAQSLGCMGDAQARTPYLDGLARQGMLMRHTFANTPVCCPARANLLTGKYAHKNGMIANDLRLRASETTLAEILAAQGYRTGFIGKWHLDGGPRLPGFVPPGPRRQGFEFWAANECSHNHFQPVFFHDTPTPIAETRYEAEVWADQAIDFLRRNGHDPFFLIVSMGPPHDPYGAPQRYLKHHVSSEVVPRPNWVEGVPGAGRAELAAYAAAIEAVDEQVGRLLKTLDDLGRARDTIVLVTSDHGDMLGSHGQRLKRKPWDEAIRVPGILRYPARIAAGGTSDVMFTHVDMAPTLLGLCGLAAPADMQGVDLSRSLRGETKTGPESAFFQIFVPFAGDGTPHPWRGVRTATSMYARTHDGPWILHDLARDPFQQNNLALDPDAAPLRRRMQTLLDDWMARTGDSWALNSMAPVEDRGRLYRFGTFTTIDEYLTWAKAHPQVAPQD